LHHHHRLNLAGLARVLDLQQRLGAGDGAYLVDEIVGTVAADLDAASCGDRAERAGARTIAAALVITVTLTLIERVKSAAASISSVLGYLDDAPVTERSLLLDTQD
jgi:hypothetical protein